MAAKPLESRRRRRRNNTSCILNCNIWSVAFAQACCFVCAATMAATDFKSDKIKTVYHSPMDVGELHAFVGTIIRTLDVWDETHGFIVINPAVHGAPVGSVLLWPYLRFTAEELLSGNAESRLKASMLSYVGKMISERTSFQLNYALLQ